MDGTFQQYIVLTRPAAQGGGYVSWCPDLPGWSTQGTTRDDATVAAQELVWALVAHRREQGLDPEPSVRAHTAPVPPRAVDPSPSGDGAVEQGFGKLRLPDS